ncbi:hypothetical protein [Mucilaginibacter gotjawali]|uniref:Uncharacterized protein n=2 Tax=Mucilaginibacter gotjawali TaxID=1550579 RepID=A0A839SN14_9SPHI|nr:hypothetical protein [Mucilaginibacter gotjawali]MBB3058753.1 hypothetical protein [Mucilaginibacter gotjawali]BAU55644.1 hypothetical protein MgSA37_03835 [Mucilaginibacter gotjawali]
MHPFLTRLGIEPEVQAFFEPFYRADELRNLLFDYGDGVEHFGFAFHKVPFSQNFWMAGNRNFRQVRQVVICASAMEAVSWLKNKQAAFPFFDGLLFLSAGVYPLPVHYRWIADHLSVKEFRLVFGRDLTGRVADLKLAAGIRQWPVEIYHHDDKIVVSFRSEVFFFSQETFSLNAFEKAAKYRFGIPADKPKGFDSYFDQLKANAFFAT